MLGSVSQNAILYATCSTRVGRCTEARHGVAAATSSPVSPVQVMIGWDGSAHASAAVNAVALRCWPPGSRARLVTAIDVRLSTSLATVLPGEPWSLPAPAPALSDPSDERELVRAGARAAAESLRTAGLETDEPLLRSGDPKHVLVDEAAMWPADCIFVGAKGMSRVQRVLLGSVSGAVSARARCSVEVVR
jgi:nucleotide-binding universal stress UspA family protein